MNTLLSVDTMSLFTWLVFGLAVGVMVHLIDPGVVRGGIWGTVVTGMVGAAIGGFIAPRLVGSSVTSFDLTTLLLAIVASLILSFLYRLAFRETGHIRIMDTSMSKGGRTRGQRK